MGDLSNIGAMVLIASTKLRPHQKIVLDYLAARQRIKAAALIREAIVERYDLNSPALLEEALSFFGENVRQVEQDELADRPETA